MDPLSKVIVNILVLRQHLPCSVPHLKRAAAAIQPTPEEAADPFSFQKPLRLGERRVLSAFHGLVAMCGAVESLLRCQAPPCCVCLVIGPLYRPREVFAFHMSDGALPAEAVFRCHERLMDVEWVHGASAHGLDVRVCAVTAGPLDAPNDDWVALDSEPRFAKATRVTQMYPLDAAARALAGTWHACAHTFKGLHAL